MERIPATLAIIACFLAVFLISAGSTASAKFSQNNRRLASAILASPGPDIIASSSSGSGLASQGGAADSGRNQRGRHLNKAAVVGIVIAALALGSVLLCLLLLYLLRRSSASNAVAQSGKKDQSQAGADVSAGGDTERSWSKAFSSFRVAITRARGSTNSAFAVDYALLQAATDNFSSHNLVGSGGSGCVYKAHLDDDLFAAVKRLNHGTAKHLQRDFQTEVELMSRIRHPNLVSLLGYSINQENHDHLLVYELMLNGSLEDQLHGPSRGSALTWNLRMKIALDAARGLEHLHERCSPPIIHRDFKSSNILLDASFNAKVSDFGLAILSSDITEDKNVELQGTFGYVAPEYFLDGIVSEKSDVYAFGVMLLELITGRKPIDMAMPIGSQSLVTWAAPQLTERAKLTQLLDPALRKDSMDSKHLPQVAAIAAVCIQSEPSYRPLITDVVSSLVPLVPLELGGVMRSAGSSTEHRCILEKKSFFSMDGIKSFSFSDYTSKHRHDDDTHDPIIKFSMSARMAKHRHDDDADDTPIIDFSMSARVGQDYSSSFSRTSSSQWN